MKPLGIKLKPCCLECKHIEFPAYDGNILICNHAKVCKSYDMDESKANPAAGTETETIFYGEDEIKQLIESVDAVMNTYCKVRGINCNACRFNYKSICKVYEIKSICGKVLSDKRI